MTDKCAVILSHLFAECHFGCKSSFYDRLQQQGYSAKAVHLVNALICSAGQEPVTVFYVSCCYEGISEIIAA